MSLICQQVSAIVTEIMVTQRNGLESSAKLFYLDPVAIMDRFIGQSNLGMYFFPQRLGLFPTKGAFSPDPLFPEIFPTYHFNVKGMS